METITCRGCGETHSVELHYKSTAKNNVNGKNPYCIQCCKVNRALEAVRKRDKSSKISVRQLNRAKNSGVEYDVTVKLVEVYKRDRGICGICKKWVVPGKASMDHKMPIIRKGSHTYDNIQLTHFTCNVRKGAKDHGHG